MYSIGVLRKLYVIAKGAKPMAAMVLTALAGLSLGQNETLGNPLATYRPTTYGYFNSTEDFVAGKHHTGVDSGGSSTVVAIGSGMVTTVVPMSKNDHGMGNCVVVRHTIVGGGIIYSLYAHMASIAAGIQPNTLVDKGTPLGIMGGSGYGNPTYWGKHLHLEIKAGNTTGNPVGSAKPLYWGYTPSDATGFGYFNPADYLGRVQVLTNDPWPWHALPGGTSRSIATSDTNGLLYFLHRGDDAKMYYGWMDSSQIFTSWHQLPGETNLSPSMTVLNGTRFIAHLGQDGRIYMGSLSGTTFSGWSFTGDASADAPSLAQFSSRIYMIHRGSGGDQGIYIGAYTAQAGWYWRDVIPGIAPGRPTLATLNGELWAAHRGLDGTIYVADLSKSYIWSKMGGTSTTDPSMCEWNHRLYLAHKGQSNNHIYVWSTDGQGTWTLEFEMPSATNIQPTLFTFYGQLFVVRVDPNNAMSFVKIR